MAAAAPAPALVSIAVPQPSVPIHSASIAGVDSEGRTTYVITGSAKGSAVTGMPTSHVHLQSHSIYISATLVAASDYFSGTEVTDQQTIGAECGFQPGSASALCTVQVGAVATGMKVVPMQTQVLDVPDKPNSSSRMSYSALAGFILAGLALAHQCV